MPIINHCLSSLQMSFEFFFWLVRCPNTQKERSLTWLNMWLGSSLTFSPSMFLLKFPRHQNFGSEKEGVFPSLKYWNISNRPILPLFQENLFSEIAELEWQIFQDKKEDSFDTHARTHTRTHAHTHTHTHTHTQFKIFCRYILHC